MSQATCVFAQVDTKDYEEYLLTYGIQFLELVEPFGGELLAATPEGTQWEGV